MAASWLELAEVALAGWRVSGDGVA
jgi:hypothetical protein